MVSALQIMIGLTLMTVVGHGIWILLAKMLRQLLGEKGDSQSEVPDKTKDLIAFDRILAYMVWSGKISNDERSRLSELAGLPTVQTSQGRQQPDVSPQAAVDNNVIIASEVGQQEPNPTPASATTLAPKTEAHPLDADPIGTSVAGYVAHPVSSSKRAMGEVLQSFLASNNIRWGELIAGLLIVVCSVGLVISLWNTMQRTHRLLPSIVFLLGTAGVEAAGLYTLRKWNLKDTSRAVLIIATLLIPLNIVAGIALATGEGASISLFDPFTLGVIILATITYTVMLAISGSAIFGRGSWQLAVAVGGPSFLMPFVPASVRQFGASAAWLGVIPASVIGIALVARVLDMRTKKAAKTAGWRFVLLAGIALYTLCVVTGFMALQLPRNTPTMIKLTFGMLPAVLAFMACGGELRQRFADGKNDSLRLLATSTVLIAGLIIAAMFPITLGSKTYLIAWSVVCGIVSLLLAMVLRAPKMLYVVSGASAIGILFCGSNSLAGIDWNASGAIWNRVLCGESVVMFPCIAAAFAVIAAPLRRHASWLKPIAITGGATAVIGAIVAATVAVGPSHWSGSVRPEIILAILLVNSLFFAIGGAWKFPLCIHLSAAGLTSFFVALCRPELGWFESLDLSLLQAAKASGLLLVCLLALTAVWRFLLPHRMVDENVDHIRFCWNWIYGVSLLSTILAASIVIASPWPAAGIMLVCSIAWIIASINENCTRRMVVAQLLGVVATGFAVHASQPTFFVSPIAWFNSSALWRIVAITSGFASCWHLIRFAAGKMNVTRDLVGHAPDGIERQLGKTGTIGSLFLASGTLLCAIGAYASKSTAIELSDTVEGWRRFGLTPLIAIGISASALVLQVINRRSARFANLLQSSSLYLLLLAYAAVTWLATTLPTDRYQLAIVAAGALFFGIAISLLLRRSAVRGVLFARSLEKELWPVNLATVGSVTGLTSLVLSVSGVWRPLHASGEIDQVAAIAVSIAAAILAALFATCSTWYRKQSLSAIASTLAIGSIMTAGATWLLDPQLLATQLPQLLGVGCFGLVLLQRSAYRSGIIEKLRSWQLLDTTDSHSSDEQSQLWPRDWPSSIRGLATTGVCLSLLMTLVCFLSQTLTVCDFHTPSAGIYGGWLGLALHAAAIVCWMLKSRFANNIVDASACMVLTAPILSDAIVCWRSLPVSDCWAIMLAIISVATIIAAVVSFIPKFGSPRSGVVPVTSSSLLMLGGILSAMTGATHSSTWLTAWAIGTLVSFGVTVHRGSAKWIRLLGGVPVVSGVLLAAVFYDQATTLWTKLFMSDSRVTVIVVVISWILACGVLWRGRFIAFKKSAEWNQLSRFTIDIVLLWSGTVLAFLMSLEVASRFMRNGLIEAQRFGLPLGLMLAIALVAVAVSCVRWDRRGQLSIAYLLIVSIVTCGVGIIASNWLRGSLHQFAIEAIALGMLTALAAWTWPLRHQLGKFLRQRGIPWEEDAAATMHQQLGGWFIATLLFTMLGTAFAIIREVDATVRWMWICSIVACGISIGRLGGSGKSGRMRTLSIASLCAAAMFGAVADVRGVDLGNARPLAQCMRLFIASVWLIPLVAWLIPRALALDSDRWREPIRRSAILMAGIAVISLIAIFVQELFLRIDDIGIPAIPTVLVYGTSIVIGLFSLLAMAVALVPGKFLVSSRDRLRVRHRQFLVYGSQVLMLLAVSNKFLCQPETRGIREYWPYMVMGFAFISAGLSAWAQRRGDDVLLQPFRSSAFFLPLIPIIGFWITTEGGWIFGGSEINYNLLLVLAAAFYLALSAVWPGDRLSRILGIVAANAALWVTLTQHSGWGFMEHPQLWLIPPAACVLAAVHFEKHRLQPKFVTACRYAATLVIYISSTADMIVQQIGSSISGPIILIIIAFVGVAAGVVLRVRAFLYLGTGFIVIGLVSMVWHAGRAIDQVWPWWAFGITTGFLLLVGLMAIEKNKDSLKRLAGRLNQWEA